MADKRRSAAHVSDAIQAFLRESGMTERIEQAQVLSEWTNIVGPEIAAVTQPRSVTADGTLFLYVNTHSWMSELSLREPEIVRAIGSALPKVGIRKVRLLLRRY